MRSISRTFGAACAAAASAVIVLWINSFFSMALKTICSFKKNREGKIKSIFNLNMTSRGEETKKKRNVLVRFEALEEFFKKNQLFCANLFYLTVFSVAKFH